MKNLKIANLVIFAAGAIIGATTGIYIYKKTTDEANEIRIQEELESIKEYAERSKAKHEETDEVPEWDSTDDDRPVGDIRRDDEEEDDEDYLPKKESTQYNTISGNSVVEEEPYIMDVEKFFEDDKMQDKVTLTYYAADGALVDDNEELITDINNTVGHMTLQNFGKLSDGPDVVYVRNEKLGIDYEIIRVYNSYAEDVLGIEMGELSKNERIRGA